MKAIRAHVQDGKVVLDEPMDLPEAAVEVLVPENEEMTSQERAHLEAEIEASAAEFGAGEYEDAHAFALRSSRSREGVHLETERSPERHRRPSATH